MTDNLPKQKDLFWLIIIIGLLVIISIFLAPKPHTFIPHIIVEPNIIEITLIEPIYEKEEPIKQSLGWFWVTAYCKGSCCCGKFADGYTASGAKAEGLICATDPMIPFHLELEIEGYGIARIEDRGGAIQRNKIDILMATHEEALEWGRQYLEIFCWVRYDN